MASKINLFPVDNGDMTLIQTESGHNILIDLNIRVAADDPGDDTPDVARMLRNRLERDVDGRLYVDALLLSHPDKDHCTGLEQHFHLGPPDNWSEGTDKIFIREMWSSPMVFRRESRKNPLCEDAEAFNREAKRRVRQYLEDDGIVDDGDRILILGEDEKGKTDDLSGILVRVDEIFSHVAGEDDPSMTALLLAPLPADDEDHELDLSKNQSSTILRFTLAGDHDVDACRFLTGGDADVAIWELLWKRHSWQSDQLTYDILLAPHHCSWGCLSHESWSEKGEDAKVSKDARNALSQARDGASIVVSSKPIKDDDDDPPCIRAKREYEDIVDEVSGEFNCVGEHPSVASPDVMVFEIGMDGPQLNTKRMTNARVRGSDVIGGQPQPHG